MSLTIILAQLNATVGDVPGNLDKAIKAITQAKQQHADVIVFPECFLSGYPADDLLYRDQFLENIKDAINTLQQHCDTILCVMGHPQRINGALYNCASLLTDNDVQAVYQKQYLPNEGVFDEQRYFTAGKTPCVLPYKGVNIGVVICEDVWHQGPIEDSRQAGADLIVVPNASPFSVSHHSNRQKVLANKAKIPLVYVNMVGGQDDLVFDGGSMAINHSNQRCAQAAFFAEELMQVQFINENFVKQQLPAEPSEQQRIYDALVMGVRDYVHKNGFSKVMLGLSGGIDSALALAIAVDALGKDNVTAIGMPSRYTSQLSLDLAQEQVDAIGVDYQIISIDKVYQAFLDELGNNIQLENSDLPQQNCQSRCRGNILMTLSNASNALVINTGNRSELAMGYATLYGDMVGAFCALKDIPKTMVYQLAEYRNRISPIIPLGVIERAPSAELAPDQKDEDSLPPYDILDDILDLYINQEMDVKAIIAKGHNAETVKRVIKLLYQNEYKRKQAAPGVRINPKAFGRDRRYPITSGFNES